MDLLKSAWLLLLGILKRIYWLVPALALDPFDFAERLFKVSYIIPQWVMWVLVSFGLAIAVILTYHDLRKQKVTLEKDRDQLQMQLTSHSTLDARPAIKITPEMNGHDISISVHNTGGYGELEAQVQIISGAEYNLMLPKKYSACWKKTMKEKTQLMKGQIDELKIASLEISNPPSIAMCLRLYFYDATSGQINWRDSTSWIPAIEGGIVKPEFVMQITISSNPSLREGAFVKNYKLSLNGLEELPSQQN